jgi:hypothetical protein
MCRKRTVQDTATRCRRLALNHTARDSHGTTQQAGWGQQSQACCAFCSRSAPHVIGQSHWRNGGSKSPIRGMPEGLLAPPVLHLGELTRQPAYCSPHPIPHSPRLPLTVPEITIAELPGRKDEGFLATAAIPGQGPAQTVRLSMPLSTPKSTDA